MIYTFISNLFLRTRTSQSQEAPTDLIAIPVYMHEEAAHLTMEIATLHQRVLEEDYTFPSFHIWENVWNAPHFSLMKNLSWSEEVEKSQEAEQPEQEEEEEIMM
jgi:hypothetical protein